ncbi:hypothetical protein [Specibacter cremeus]|uniref:hypothetical protein n=1 Tax=Specibacter cremeus TaxID=1629051 RepID=UPI000F780AB2|nr:hypothetical protein [Specibacter cremeus]
MVVQARGPHDGTARIIEDRERQRRGVRNPRREQPVQRAFRGRLFGGHAGPQPGGDEGEQRGRVAASQRDEPDAVPGARNRVLHSEYFIIPEAPGDAGMAVPGMNFP